MKLFSKGKMLAAAFALGGALLYGSATTPVVASDHDDGETQIKARNLNLTDLYVFREDWQTGVAADSGNLIFVMNTNPRSLPRQQYFFNTEATYSIHVAPQDSVDNAVNGRETYRMDFRFAEPNESGQQTFEMDFVTLDQNGAPAAQVTATGGQTNPAPGLLGNTEPPVTNTFTVDGNSITVFAGLREDPFFFDVEQFFKVRAFVAGAGPDPAPNDGNGLFYSENNSVDFAEGYNVNAIVARVPISALQVNGETTFDVWESITLPSDLAARQ